MRQQIKKTMAHDIMHTESMLITDDALWITASCIKSENKDSKVTASLKLSIIPSYFDVCAVGPWYSF